MDITERRVPQDGHISAQHFDGIARDIRVSSLPTMYGERLTLRMMQKRRNLPNERKQLALRTTWWTSRNSANFNLAPSSIARR
jgi:type II secretory ATPase GspE/PulE/Tfp pilus assembly ATPase PilB-like protein